MRNEAICEFFAGYTLLNFATHTRFYFSFSLLRLANEEAIVIVIMFARHKRLFRIFRLNLFFTPLRVFSSSTESRAHRVAIVVKFVDRFTPRRNSALRRGNRQTLENCGKEGGETKEGFSCAQRRSMVPQLRCDNTVVQPQFIWVSRVPKNSALSFSEARMSHLEIIKVPGILICASSIRHTFRSFNFITT